METIALALFVVGGVVAPVIFIVRMARSSKSTFRYSMTALLEFVVGTSLLLLICVEEAGTRQDFLKGLVIFVAITLWIISGIFAISWSAGPKDDPEIGAKEVFVGSCMGLYLGLVFSGILAVFCQVWRVFV